MDPFQYSVDSVVHGANCTGGPFSGRVTEVRGPFTVILDDFYVTPVSLIKGLISKSKGDEDGNG